jgi:hypothetical protein
LSKELDVCLDQQAVVFGGGVGMQEFVRNFILKYSFSKYLILIEI